MGIVAGIEGGILATLGFVGGRASLPRITSLRPDSLFRKIMRVGWLVSWLEPHGPLCAGLSPSKEH